MSIPSPSVLDRLIPPEIKGDAFYQLLRILVADASVRTLLEIGASDGQGSTEALIAGMRANPSRPVLHTIEVSRARFTALSRRYANEPGVTCHNVSSVAADAFASDAEVSDFHRSTPSPLNQFPLEQVLAWRREDLAYLESAGVEQRGIEQIKRESGIVHFDLVLIDGSEFTGPAELDAVYGANLILLDDTETLKNRANLLRLLNDTGYCLLVHDRTVRNGYAAFRKRTFRAANYASIRPAVERVQGLLVDGQDEFLFNKAASLPNDAVIVEIGAYKGRSTVALAHACIGTDRRIYSIDTWDGNDKDFSERNFFDQWKSNVDASGLSDYVTPLRGRSRDVLPQLAARLGGAKIDFAFIDGSHDFDDVMSDLRQTLPLVKTGGWIALHDVIHTWPGPLRAWHKFARPALANHAYSTTLACGQTLKTSVETLEALIAKPVDPLPVHFFTIVLNGEPFIRHHIEQFKQLPFEWHWHIVEGLADLKHDTAWSLRTGGRIPAEFHRNGRSIDGTSEYLDRLASEFADRVTVYRKPPDALWDGKREMVNAPLANIAEECLLWQLDADELWTSEQFSSGRKVFLEHPTKTAAFYHCWFFVGPDRVISTRGGYASNPAVEWLRTWRFRPGMLWAAHERPILAEPIGGDRYRNVAEVDSFTHAQTESAGLVFQHLAYVTVDQLRFKQVYYGYPNALAGWAELQFTDQLPARLGDFLPWVQDATQVDRASKFVPRPLYDPRANAASGSTRPLIVVDGVFFQMFMTGIARVWWSLLNEWVRDGFAKHILLLDRAGTMPPLAGVRRRIIPLHDYGRLERDRRILQQVCDQEHADLFVSTYYSMPETTPSAQMVYDMIPEVFNYDFSEAMWAQKRAAIMRASAFLSISENTRSDLVRFYPHVSPDNVKVTLCGVWPVFRPVTSEQVIMFRKRCCITRPYFLSVGMRHRYKNTILLFRAFGQLANRDQLQILCVGGEPQLEPELAALVPRGSALVLPRLPDEELAIAYAGAAALVYPSRYEGFGLPILEAFASGCPVITSVAGSTPEVAGDAAIYVNPDDPADLARSLQQVLDPEIRARMIQAGLERAKAFSWRQMAQKVSDGLLRAAVR